MKAIHLVAPISALLLSACMTTMTTTRTWGDPWESEAAPPPSWSRPGRVVSVREVAVRQQGDPAAGAVAGAVVGGILGSAVTGRPGGGLVGAVGGAMVGAAASEGGAESRHYEILVRFDDGGRETFVFAAPYFRPGEAVVFTPQGLFPR